ncbi:hypothetical protein ON010_g357 [Phytophthora cinnamomi]|nr:hypothetical protein ON010_g357 [Phytophthora cinnamomi]
MLRLLRRAHGATSSARFSAPTRRVPVLQRRHVSRSPWLSSGAGAMSDDAVAAENDAAKVTPMVAQYLARKKEYPVGTMIRTVLLPDCMLLFQVGDFYEFFGDDARRAAHTKKAQVHALNEMCGFPIGSVDSFVEKLSASSAKKRGYNALVDRQVVRIVTPGSLVEDTMLTPKENNYLASLFYDEDTWGLAWADLSTGEFVSTTSSSERLASAILRCSPKEILLPSLQPIDETGDAAKLDLPDEAIALLESVLPDTCMKTYRPAASFILRPTMANGRQIRGASMKALNEPEQAAVSAILDYVDFTHRGMSALIRAPLHVESSDHMIIDSSAWRGLELSKSLNGSKASSLLQAIDSTTTPGARGYLQ